MTPGPAFLLTANDPAVTPVAWPRRPFLHTLRGRMIMLLGGMMLLLMILIIVSVTGYIYQIELASWRSRQGEAAHSAAQTVASYLYRAQGMFELVSLLGQDAIRKRPESLDRLLDQYPVVLELVYLDQDGQVIASLTHNQALLANAFTIRQSQWFQSARSGHTYLSRILIPSQGAPYTVYSIPLEKNGVIAIRLKMDVLSSVVSDIHFGEQGRVYIVNQQGQVIAHTDPAVVLSSLQISDRPEFAAIKNAPQNEWYGASTSLLGQPVVVASAAVGNTGWILITELPTREAYAKTRKAAWLLALQLTGMGVLVILALSQMTTRLFLKPVDILREGALHLGQGNLDYRIPAPGEGELGEVMAAFNTMAERLKAEQAALKHLNEDLENRVQARTLELVQLNQRLAREVSERRLAEERVRASLQDKEILLKEIHHRVKNNLQVISSLLSLQAHKVTDSQTVAALLDSQHRVHSMALIHERLYQSGNLAQINLGEYVRGLAGFLARAYQDGGTVQLEVRADEIMLDLDRAVSCGLILNELITNAYKYAFPNQRTGHLEVVLRHVVDGGILLRVRDDGIGFPPDLDYRNTSSLGLQLVSSLTGQIDGTLEMEVRQGTCFSIRFAAQPQR